MPLQWSDSTLTSQPSVYSVSPSNVSLSTNLISERVYSSVYEKDRQHIHIYLISLRVLFFTHHRLGEFYYHFDTGVMTFPPSILLTITSSSYVLCLLKLKARSDVNFPVNLFCRAPYVKPSSFPLHRMDTIFILLGDITVHGVQGLAGTKVYFLENGREFLKYPPPLP